MTLFTDAPLSRRPAVIGLWARMSQMLAVRRQRRALRRLDARALADLGLSRAAAEAEAARPFWDASDTWRC